MAVVNTVFQGNRESRPRDVSKLLLGSRDSFFSRIEPLLSRFPDALEKVVTEGRQLYTPAAEENIVLYAQGTLFNER